MHVGRDKGGLLVFSVYLHVIKKHRINLLFSYYELGFRCFELNLFSHCFDPVRVRFEKFKPEQALRTLDWKDSLFTRNSLDLTKCLKFMLFYASRSDSSVSSFKNEQSHT